MAGRGRGMALTRPAWMTSGLHANSNNNGSSSAGPAAAQPLPAPTMTTRRLSPGGGTLGPRGHHPLNGRAPSPHRDMPPPPTRRQQLGPPPQQPLPMVVPRSRPQTQTLAPGPRSRSPIPRVPIHPRNPLRSRPAPEHAAAVASATLPPLGRPPQPSDRDGEQVDDDDEWVPAYDSEGRVYWYSVLTRETAWEPPAARNEPVIRRPSYPVDPRDPPGQPARASEPRRPADDPWQRPPRDPYAANHYAPLESSSPRAFESTPVPRHRLSTPVTNDRWQPMRSPARSSSPWLPAPTHRLEHRSPTLSASPVQWITPSPTPSSPAPGGRNGANGTGSGAATDSQLDGGGTGQSRGPAAGRVGKKAKRKRASVTKKRGNKAKVAPLTAAQIVGLKANEFDTFEAARTMAKQVLDQEDEIRVLRREVSQLQRAVADRIGPPNT